jgi:hypothetical protein
MSDFLEDELRRALRPVDPGDDFTHKVLARVQAQSTGRERHSRRLHERLVRWVPAALAASLLAAIIVNHEHSQAQMAEEGLRAREQLIAALRVTSEKLDLAYEAVHNQTNDAAHCQRTGACL